MEFDIDKSLKKIQTASHFLMLILLLNFCFFIYGLFKVPSAAIFMIISFLITALICAVFIQAFNTIRDHLDFLNSKITNVVVKELKEVIDKNE